MKTRGPLRSLSWSLALVALPLLGLPQPAEATGAVVCSISGTIEFSPSSPAATERTWHIKTAVIDCHGLFRATDRVLGPGPFSGSGSYSVAHGGGPCLQQIGSGTVDYLIPTSEQDVHVTEQGSFILAGAGSFDTPSLRGTFQVTSPENGDCVTKPVTTAFFLAQGVMVRFRTPQPLEQVTP